MSTTICFHRELRTFHYFCFTFLIYSRYLCDFSYFQSLHIDRNRCAFIHVPPLDMPYSVEDLAEGLSAAIHAMLKQIGL